MKFETNKEKGNTGLGIAIAYIDTNIDELFIVTDKLNIYILPIQEIRNRNTLNLCEKEVVIYKSGNLFYINFWK